MKQLILALILVVSSSQAVGSDATRLDARCLDVWCEGPFNYSFEDIPAGVLVRATEHGSTDVVGETVLFGADLNRQMDLYDDHLRK